MSSWTASISRPPSRRSSVFPTRRWSARRLHSLEGHEVAVRHLGQCDGAEGTAVAQEGGRPARYLEGLDLEYRLGQVRAVVRFLVRDQVLRGLGVDQYRVV